LRDLAVQLVCVRPVHPVADCGQAALKARTFGADLGGGALLILTQGVDNPCHHLRRHLETLQRLAKAHRDVFLPETRQIALAPIPRASVVDVLLFLHVAGEHASVVGTVHEASKCNLPLRILGTIVSPENRLLFVKGLRVNEQRMTPGIPLPTPLKASHIELVFEDQGDVRSAHDLAVVSLEHRA
jgi:hypothetical protein